MGSIVKRQFEDHIRFLLLQYPSDLKRVCQDASEYFGQEITRDQVLRIRRKMKSQQDKDTALWVASNITQQLFQGIRERQAKLEAMFATWAGAEQGMVSVCCRGPVKKMEPMQGEPYFRCLVCEETCNVNTEKYPEVEKLKMKIIQEMRKESELIVKFAKDLGFTNQPDPGNTEKVTNNNFIMVNGQERQHPSRIPIDSEAAQRLQDMSPVERERVIKSIEKMSVAKEPPVDAEFVSKNEETSEQL